MRYSCIRSLMAIGISALSSRTDRAASLPNLANEVPTPAERVIRIKKEWGYRANSANWKSHSACSLMMHESMHLLSLVDEYIETARTKPVVVNGKKVNRLEYNCRAAGPDDSLMSDQTSATWHSGLDWFSRLFNRDGRPSLLAPTQFRAITEPGCVDRNPIYYGCGINAYLTSASHGGTGCVKDVPKECKSTDWIEQLP
jgi:hypothetical protein